VAQRLTRQETPRWTTSRPNTEYLSLMDKSVEDILREGQKALFARLVSACRAGTANHQELAILRNILKDNGLTLGIPPEKPNGGRTAAPAG
jgi:hypothetical protein